MLPKRKQEILLNKVKELFLSYWSDTSKNIVTLLVMDAVELVLKLIKRCSKQEATEKAAGVTNVHQI